MAHRTQAQRRAATTDKVLAATIDCLVDRGYANTSTRHIARRAGVTVGALQHHFESKAHLMAAALQRLGEHMADDFLADVPPGAEDDDDRLVVLLDHMWRVHRSPLFEAGVELWVAARTDPELRAAMSGVQSAFTARISAGAAVLFSGLASEPGFAERVMVGLATMRGLAMPGFVEAADPDTLWSIARPLLVQTLAMERSG